MNRVVLESALRILLAHRHSRSACQLTRAAIRSTINAIRSLRHAHA